MFKTTKKGTFKKEKWKNEHFEVARTRNCEECGSDEEMRWLALHPSVTPPKKCLGNRPGLIKKKYNHAASFTLTFIYCILFLILSPILLLIFSVEI